MFETFARKSIGGAALAAALAFATSHAHANGTVSVALSSTVGTVCTITTSATTVLLPDLSTNAETNFNFANLTESCNAPGGYSVKLTSGNVATGTQLFLKGSVNANDTINYSLGYNGSPVSYNGTTTLESPTSPTTTPVTRALTITTSTGAYAADSYSDLLTITLTAS